MPEPNERPEVRIDDTDVRFGWIGAVVAALAIGLLTAAALAAWMYHAKSSWRTATEAASRSTSFTLPAAPRLEPLATHTADPGSSFLAQQAAQEAQLHRFGRTDDPGYVHVPIERAIARLAEELQSGARPPPRGAKSQGLVNSGDANSGRRLRKDTP